jgi:nucleotide-binding universal stress UspA family protein
VLHATNATNDGAYPGGSLTSIVTQAKTGTPPARRAPPPHTTHRRRARRPPMPSGRPSTRIVLPLDGSALAETMLPIAAAWAKAGDAEIVLLRAAAPDRPSAAAPGDTLLETPEEWYLLDVADRLQRCGVADVRITVAFDAPASAIVEAARREEADLIAMATHGRTGLGRALLGSVAETVVRAAGVPVLLIRGRTDWHVRPISRILVALDGTERAEAILPIAARLARSQGANLLLLRVIEPPGLNEAGIDPQALTTFRQDYADRYVAKIADSLAATGVRARGIVRRGRAPETIADVAVLEGASLIAMSTRARRGVKRLVLGSVAADVLAIASVPLLLAAAPGV